MPCTIAIWGIPNADIWDYLMPQVKKKLPRAKMPTHHIVEYATKVIAVWKHLRNMRVEIHIGSSSVNTHQLGKAKQLLPIPLSQNGSSKRDEEISSKLHTDIYTREAILPGDFLRTKLLLDLR
jgi:hypothetical protein